MPKDWKYLFFAMRPKQWVKNLFVLVPLIFGQKLFEFPASVHAVLAFVLFCMTASSVYLTNDILDLEQDRLHRTKRLRPLAAKKVTLVQAKLAALVLSAVSLFLATLLQIQLAGVLLAYQFLNFLYTRFLKEIVILDVFCIGIFFVMRIAAGTLVTGVAFSHWMIFLVFLLAMFLGFHKRRQELMLAGRNSTRQRFVLYKYTPYFIDQMTSVLTSSIVVIYMLYTIDQRTVNLFQTRHLIYTIPFVYYGIFRYQYLIYRWKWGEDPSLILFSDALMKWNLLAWLMACIAIIYFKI